MRLKHRQDDWETLKNKSWAELSEEEKRKLIIANDVGVVITEIQIEKMLEELLPKRPIPTVVVTSTATSITLTNSITTIGEDAFYSCMDLISINIPNSV